MLKKYAITRTYKVNQSKLLVKWLVFIHILSIVAALLNTLAIAYKSIVIVAIVMSLIIHIKKVYKMFVIRYNPNSGWELANSQSHFDPIELIGSTVITQYLIVLHYKMQKRQKRTMIICKDALIDDHFRMLVVQLKISGLVTSNS